MGTSAKTTINLAFARYLDSNNFVSSINERSNDIRLNSYKDKTIPCRPMLDYDRVVELKYKK